MVRIEIKKNQKLNLTGGMRNGSDKNITLDSKILHYLFTTGTKDEKLAKLLESILNQILAYIATEQIKA
ncbi:hypothetical protein [Caldicellulosiruptor acetigenus]|uniref:hypothetical protein n=1 Tax=Caldicellulosiruptor acetigenus TaxID=301953 RepID=UPI0001E9978C|nr:hypothetical protein [Caldicellulosiruptor acetigenus]